jgi:hypothetical protein
MSNFIPKTELDTPTEYSKSVTRYQKNQTDPDTWKNIAKDNYINWQSNQPVDASNYMHLTTGPQLNPFGITGNPYAMTRLEIQKPQREPSNNNPFMNVPIQDYNIKQRFGRSQKYCGKSCNDKFYRRLYQTPEDALYEHQSSQRQFYTMPITSNPNEQTKFAMWLYGNNFVGKTGSLYDRYGYPYTPDSLVNTGVNAASPQNGGQVDHNFGTPVTPGSSPWVNNPNYGYGFGGVPGGIPFANLSNNAGQLYPMPIFPVFPSPVHLPPSETVPPGLPTPNSIKKQYF